MDNGNSICFKCTTLILAASVEIILYMINLEELGEMYKQMSNDSKSDTLYTLFFFAGKRMCVTFIVKL